MGGVEIFYGCKKCLCEIMIKISCFIFLVVLILCDRKLDISGDCAGFFSLLQQSKE